MVLAQWTVVHQAVQSIHNKHIAPTVDVKTDEDLKQAEAKFTSDTRELHKANYHAVHQAIRTEQASATLDASTAAGAAAPHAGRDARVAPGRHLSEASGVRHRGPINCRCCRPAVVAGCVASLLDACLLGPRGAWLWNPASHCNTCSYYT